MPPAVRKPNSRVPIRHSTRGDRVTTQRDRHTSYVALDEERITRDRAGMEMAVRALIRAAGMEGRYGTISFAVVAGEPKYIQVNDQMRLAGERGAKVISTEPS